MKIYGKEYHFRFSVGTAMEIAKHCPEGKLEKLEDVLNNGTAEALEVLCTLAEHSSKAYEQAKAFESGEKVQPHLTREMAKTLDFKQLTQLNQEVMAAMNKDKQTTVEVDETDDGTKKKAEEEKTTKSE